MAQHTYDRCAPPWDQWFLNGTNLDDALAELGGDESPEAEAARTVRRMSTDATSREFQVRLKRE